MNEFLRSTSGFSVQRLSFPSYVFFDLQQKLFSAPLERRTVKTSPEHRLSENYSSHLVWKWVLFFSLINKTVSVDGDTHVFLRYFGTNCHSLLDPQKMTHASVENVSL